MKKLLIIVTMLFTVSLAACGDSDAVPEPGVWNEDIFVNESLGIQFQLPGGWESVEGEELVELLGVGADFLSAIDSDLANDEILEAMEENPLHDMYAMNRFTGSTVQVMFQRLPRAARRYSSEEALEFFIETMEEEMGSFNLSMRSGNTTIGKYEFYSAEGVLELMPGFEIQVLMFLRLEGRNASIISLGSMMDNEFDDILYYFNEPGTARIEIEGPDVAEASDLIGRWAWNLDEDYIYIFNEDGSGVRGYADVSIEDVIEALITELGEDMVDDLLDQFSEEELLEMTMEELVVEEFKWEIVDGVLYLDFAEIASLGLANEEWDAVIDGNMLIIESRQAPGLAYTYIRQ